jgi:chromosome segregation ATPase
MAHRVVNSLVDTASRLDEKIERLDAQLKDAQAAREAVETELDEARTALEVTAASPLLAQAPSHGGAAAAPADPATGKGN